MKTIINRLQSWFDAHTRAKEWGWFVLLWLIGLAAVMCVAYPIKYIIRIASYG